MTNKTRLYHFSNKENTGVLTVESFGYNGWTDRDKNASDIKRKFFYLENEPIEYRFKNCLYCYIVELDKADLYDLRIDELDFIRKARILDAGVDIDRLLTLIKEAGYLGTIYNTGGFDVACTFYTVPIYKTIKRREAI